MATNALQIESRASAGKGVARKLRAAGRIPGVCYGKNEAAIAISLDPTALRRLIERSEAGMNTILSLEGVGALAGKMALVRELQRDPVKGTYLHADLYTVDVTRSVDVKVPIHLTGKPKGVEFEGGVMDHSLRELELSCKPLAIPSEVRVDVSALGLGDSLHVRDLTLPEGVELRSDPDLSVVSVVAPAKEEEPAAAAAEAPVEGEAPAEGAAAAPSEEASED